MNNNTINLLNDILKNTKMDGITSEGAGYEDLPEGYYLVEVEKAELKETKETQLPMASFRFTNVADGISFEQDDNGYLVTKELKGTKGRKQFINWVLKDEASVKRFVSDMLKFEGSEPGEPILPREAFEDGEILEPALEALTGVRIYVQISAYEGKDGNTYNWTNLISWKRAAKLELPM